MKKLLSILLIFSILFPFIGTYTYLQIQKGKVKRQVKHRMIDGMDKSELVSFTFSKNESETLLRWEHSKEFEYSGQMYDVVEKQIIGDSLYLVCWPDNKETQLNCQLRRLVSDEINQDPVYQENVKRLQQFQFSMFYDKWNSDNNVISLNDLTLNYCNFVDNYISVFLTPPKPPPKFA